MLPDKLKQILNGDNSLETRKDVADIFLDLCEDDKIKEFAQILLNNIETLECPEGVFESLFESAIYDVELSEPVPYDLATIEPEATNYTFCFDYGGKHLTLSIDRNDEYIVTNIEVITDARQATK